MMKLLIASLLALLFQGDMSGSGKTEFINPSSQVGKPLFSFGIVADVQYCDGEPEGTRFYRNSLSKLRVAMNSFRRDSVDFVINLGDLIDRDFESYKPVLKIIDSSRLKTYNLTGNHDYSVENRLKKRIPLLQPGKTGYYSFVYKGFRFIALNGNELSTYASNSKSEIKEAEEYISALINEGAVNAIDWNGGVSLKQLEWLTDQLDEAVLKGETVFILCHFPVYPENLYNLLNYKEVLNILKNYNNIIAWFNGHNHAGNYGNFHAIHFLTMKGMVETENAGSFSLVEVFNNKIWIKGSEGEKSQILAY
jgi:manganese-dependent ADP-ribose/CDP-alcohol diphosphatase